MPTTNRLTPRTSCDSAAIGEVAISPDGADVVYAERTVADGADRTGPLAGARTRGGRARRLTGGAWTDGRPRFSPDGRTLAFTSDRENETAQVWLLPMDGRRGPPADGVQARRLRVRVDAGRARRRGDRPRRRRRTCWSASATRARRRRACCAAWTGARTTTACSTTPRTSTWCRSAAGLRRLTEGAWSRVVRRAASGRQADRLPGRPRRPARHRPLCAAARGRRRRPARPRRSKLPGHAMRPPSTPTARRCASR